MKGKVCDQCTLGKEYTHTHTHNFHLSVDYKSIFEMYAQTSIWVKITLTNVGLMWLAHGRQRLFTPWLVFRLRGNVISFLNHFLQSNSGDGEKPNKWRLNSRIQFLSPFLRVWIGNWFQMLSNKKRMFSIECVEEIWHKHKIRLHKWNALKIDVGCGCECACVSTLYGHKVIRFQAIDIWLKGPVQMDESQGLFISSELWLATGCFCHNIPKRTDEECSPSLCPLSNLDKWNEMHVVGDWQFVLFEHVFHPPSTVLVVVGKSVALRHTHAVHTNRQKCWSANHGLPNVEQAEVDFNDSTEEQKTRKSIDTGNTWKRCARHSLSYAHLPWPTPGGVDRNGLSFGV